MRLMSRIEAIPLESMKKRLPWDWVTFPEFLDSLDRQQLGVNVGAMFPFSALRGYVVGMGAAPQRTSVTDAELNQKFRGQQLVHHMLFLPFLAPGLVIGIGLPMSLGPLHLSAMVGSRWAVVIGHCLWATPLVFIVMVSVLHSIDWSLVDAAKSLGARPMRAFYEITLPLVRPGGIASLILAFVVSFHEFIIALFLTGPNSRTLPVLVWNSLRLEVSPIIAAIDAMMIITIVLALLVLAKSVGIERITMH